ncbi:alpha-2-HS-glycoprotein 1 [Pleuronectes platessa]|uniref:alpha-2-HS-glycoprotein 1 n=1 Tax=Pleuronectes platessa TaxID=8262 RepID=UPI00232A79BE|nr:alpha-2-HS-glycoprotein 1 [Pleuronectes platessa]
MKALNVLVLLASVVLLCRASPVLEPVMCNEDHSAAAARMAVHDINEHHKHGYKFRLSEIKENKMDKVEEGCTIELHLDLLETKCHSISPKHFEDCETRQESSGAVMANCTVMMAVKDGNANVTRYDCDTRQVRTNREMSRMCPDCPTLIPLNSHEALTAIEKAVHEENINSTNEHFYVLQEVGRVMSGWMSSQGMYYSSEFVIVETHCPMGSRIAIQACDPLCPDRARHAFCRSFYTKGSGLRSVDCEYYPALNTTALGPGEKEPQCQYPHLMHLPRPAGHPSPAVHHPSAGGGRPPPPPPPHAHGHGQGPPSFAGSGPPPHAHGHGHGPPSFAGSAPPPHAHGHGQGPPSFAGGQGPPPHAKGPINRERVLPFFIGPCNGFLAYSDPALHPICPKPLPEPRNIPELARP